MRNYTQISVQNGFYKNVCIVIRFRGHKNNLRHVQGNAIQHALSPSTPIF